MSLRLGSRFVLGCLLSTSALVACSGASAGLSGNGILADDGGRLGPEGGQPLADASPEGAVDGSSDSSVRDSDAADSATVDAGCHDDASAACEGKCGTLLDSCGSPVQCAGCGAGQTCGGGGSPNVCGSGPCEPACAGKACGASDGCGGLCTQGSCGPGQSCAGGTCTCDPATCSGCCEGTACQVGSDPAACGAGGGVCQACSGTETCSQGTCAACVPDCSGAACGASDHCGGTCATGTCDMGQECLSGSCVCDATSCPNGCCSGNSCLLSTTSSACGEGGGACTFCTSTQSCAYGTCVNAVPLWTAESFGYGSSRMLALDPAGEYAYFIDQNDSTSNMSIWRVPTAGGSGEVVASGLNWAVALAVDSSNVYWLSTGDDTVVAQSLFGGSPRVLATGQYFPSDIAVIDSTTVFWSACNSAGSACNVWSVPVSGGSPTSLYAGNEGPRLAAVSPNVYAAVPDQEMLSLAIAGGGTSVAFDSGLLFDGVAATSSQVAWFAGETAISAGNGTVKAMPTSWISASGSLAPIVIASGQNPESIAIDASYVYWANHDDSEPYQGSILRAPLSGGAATTLVTGIDADVIAVDGDSVIWLGSTDAIGGVFKTVK